MTEASENGWVVRVRAQVMCRDEGTGGWVALGGGGLAHVMIGRRTVSTAGAPSGEAPTTSQEGEAEADEEDKHPDTRTEPSDRPTTPEHTRTEPSSSEEKLLEEPREKPTHEYYIHGRRISDNLVVLECTIKKDFMYNKVMPTFHHWVTGERRFGLTFQTAADARAFDRGVRSAVEDLLDGLGGAWQSPYNGPLFAAPTPLDEKKEFDNGQLGDMENASGSHQFTPKQSQSDEARRKLLDINLDLPTMKEEDEEKNIFECLNLPKSNSSSEGSVHRRRMTEDISQTPILSAITLPMPLHAESQCDLGQEDITEHCPYVHLSAVHEYTYPQLGSGVISSSEKSSPNTRPPLLKRDSGSIKCAYSGPPPLPDKKPAETFQARLKCRHCHEWYLESANRSGACEFAPDCFKSCIDCVSCIKCAQCMVYHCMSDAEGEFPNHPCSCSQDTGCAKRWLGITLLSLVVPCLWCYLPLRCVHRAARALNLAGGTHKPHTPASYHRK